MALIVWNGARAVSHTDVQDTDTLEGMRCLLRGFRHHRHLSAVGIYGACSLGAHRRQVGVACVACVACDEKREKLASLCKGSSMFGLEAVTEVMAYY